MIKVKMENKDGVIVEMNACDILSAINDEVSIYELNALDWGKDEGKKNYLQCKKAPLVVNYPTEPLTDEEAEQAIKEYKEKLGLN
jgi:hypothetical protein